jgi:hypothetical protein
LFAVVQVGEQGAAGFLDLGQDVGVGGAAGG